ncbi:MAG: AarF/UbiB family protein [Eubacteriales bacterium]|nr:AarF/UbiB family protein [Eubacteriales bacterium]
MKEIISILSKHNILQGMSPEKLCAIVEELGPTFVKLGQIMSMRPDMIPQAYCDELQKLRADVTPMSSEEVRRVVEASLGMELHTAFPTFDFTPLGSASIAQAHRAVLPGGENVVVKVQREGIHDKMANDIALLRKAAAIMKLTPTGETIDFGMVLDEMWVVSQEEMNFATEAKNAEEFRRLNEDVAYVSCPKIYREVSTSQVLVMEAINGLHIDEKDELTAQGYDMTEISRKLCVNYMKQILDDGFFHADPHPGNLLIRDGEIVWIDLGMVGRLSPKDQTAFKKAASGVVAHDVGAVMEAVLAIGKHSAPIDREALYRDCDNMLAEYMEMDMGSMDLASMMQQLMELAKKHKISMPSGMTMLARGLGTIQGVVADISPEINLMTLVSERFARDMWHGFDLKKMLSHDFQAIYESEQKSLSIPSLLSDTLRAVQKGEMKLRTERVLSKEVEQARNQRVDRMRGALLCASLFLGSSVMTLANVEPRWFGLPWVSVVGFGLSLSMALYGYWVERKKK